MPTEFPLFSALPTELREDIWNLAIRPNYSGVHIFRVYGTFQDHQTLPQEAIHFSHNESPFRGRERDELGLAVPLPHKGLDRANKPSAKSISTSMMKKAFPTIKDTRHGKVYISKPVMGYYLSGGAPSYFTIKPMSDLFILRRDSLYFDLENIDQALSHDCAAFHQIMDLCHNALWPCIWLVDYNLKRKANAPPYKSGCFYAGDRKLIVVDFLEEDSRDHWDYINATKRREKTGLKLCSTLR
ncbi:uncharacterized protein BKA55DRAFT_596931 [Fusarium redolens]|uniref:2EXR domain-containing protein n=1 Tax=Fusarium redolens TaxID=48865 RepID=A0A9P9GKK2_FUSRE|nr:uncharacterized protein BKA55DRAFT_596931 [Fusarium redolens]KAH7240368.1 hypothetical protein BKA55DRAFT_596931 [Fusarium redolens]